MSTVDSVIALRIVHLLITPFSKWKACEEGIIDENGVRSDKEADSTNWTMLHRLVWRIKLMLGKVPGGSSQLGTLTAAYLLVKEQYENDKIDEGIAESEFLSFKKETKVSFKDTVFVSALIEEAPANVAGNVAGTTGEPPVKILRKKKKNDPTINQQP